MSNQVFSNDAQKYFACPGINSFATVLTPVVNGATVLVPFSAPVLQQGKPTATITTPGILRFNKSGVYSINAKLEFSDSNLSTPPLANEYCDMLFYMRLTGGFQADQTKLAEQKQQFTIPGADGSAIRVITLSYTGYFGAGDSVEIYALNNRTTRTTNIRAENSGLLVSQLI